MSPARARVAAFLALFGASALLTSGAVCSALSQDAGESQTHWLAQIAASTGATLLGPFLGGFSRNWQSCCAEYSRSLFPVAGSALAFAIAMQFVPLPPGRGWERVRILTWVLGWLVWFGSGLFSLLHALE